MHNEDKPVNHEKHERHEMKILVSSPFVFFVYFVVIPSFIGSGSENLDSRVRGNDGQRKKK
jgi:hypothetical protein